MTASGQESLTIHPSPGAWPALLGDRAISDEQRSARESLNVPTDAPIIMTGHQAEFWHPGVLAKYFAAECAARRLNARAAFIVVDQDTNPVHSVRYPKAGPVSATWTLPPYAGLAHPPGMTGEARPLSPGDDPLQGLDPALPCVRDGLVRIAAALRKHADAPNAAMQVTRAALDVAGPALAAVPVVAASSLHRLPLFARVIAAMSQDPRACVGAYNSAARSIPDAGIDALALPDDDGQIELPLWRVGRDGARERVRARELTATPIESLRPRALLLTALLRAVACDVFIHGLGGGAYDQVTDRWTLAWMPELRLAPVAVITATRRLPFGVRPLPPRDSLVRDVWRAHHAAHHPGQLGDTERERRRHELVEAIENAKRLGQDPSPHFHALHALIDESRNANGPALAPLRAAAAAAREGLGRAAQSRERVISDRTWPFPLYPPDVIASLHAEVDASFAH